MPSVRRPRTGGVSEAFIELIVVDYDVSVDIVPVLVVVVNHG
jgi:hypothetical protein